jgi:two-component system OmpR family sensor kinase
MKLPIRARLTAWYVLLLAAILVVLGTYLVLSLRADLQAKTDGALRRNAAQIARGYMREGPEDFLDVSRTTLPPDGAAQVLDSGGRVLHAFGAVAGRAMVGGTLQAKAQRTDSPVTSVALGNDQDYRAVAVPAARAGQGDLVVVAASLRDDQEAVERLVILLLLGGPAAILATALGGWWLARRALLPVERMTKKAEQIGVDRLDERIAVPHPEDEVGHLAVTLNAMLDRLEQGVRDKQRLIADASHELRTPLAVMRAELDVSLRGDDLTPAAREVLVSAREEVDRMSRTVSNLLTLAAVDEGRLELLTTRVRMHDAIDAAARPLRPLADAKRLTLTLNGDPVEAQADPQRLHQALTNFIENAIKFSPSDGDVQVAAWRRNGEVGVTVTDAGPGIPAGAAPHVFDRFYRVDSARGRAVGGSGLGLAICREVAVAHGGRVWVDSEEGKGSAFSLALPA